MMDLRSGLPVWLANRPRHVRAGPLRRDLSCDVVIVGAGITGTLVGHALLEAGLDVVVLDARKAGTGSTAASTGLLLYQPDTTIAELSRQHSLSTARRTFQLGALAISDLRRIVRRLNIQCGWRANRALYVGHDSSDWPNLKEEAQRTRRIGFPVTALSPAALRKRFQLDRPGALLSPGSAQIDAFRLTQGILQHDVRAGLHLFQDTKVKRLDPSDQGVTARTSAGFTVRARFAVVAAGYEAARFVKNSLVQLHSTYVIASPRQSLENIARLKCLMWETSRPYFYLRTTDDHRIIFGGADEPLATPSRRDRKLRAKTRLLEQQFAELFPDLRFKAEFAWTGTFADTKDGLPCIGPITTGSRILCALGYGGNGITFSQIAARLLRDHCIGRRNPDAHLYALERKHRARR